MSYQLIHQALTQSIIDLALGVPIAHENVDFDPSGVDSFIDVTLLPAITEVISKDTLDVESGIYQVSAYVRTGVSTAPIYAIADAVQGFYKHGVELVNGAQTVFIDHTERNGGRNLNGWFILDLSINYTADLTR